LENSHLFSSNNIPETQNGLFRANVWMRAMRLVVELLQYFWSAISSWEDIVFSYMFSIEPLEFFAHLCAGFLAYCYSFNAISLFITTL